MFLNASLENTHHTDISQHSIDDLYKIFINKCDCYLLLKQYENAINFAQKCINIQPQSIKAHIILGNSYMELQQFTEAKEEFDKAYVLAQNNNNINDNNILKLSQLIINNTPKFIKFNECYNYKNVVNQWTNNIFDDRNDIIMEYEASQINNCKSYELCPCLNRLINILIIYKLWCNNYLNKWGNITILSIIKQLKYENGILNDLFRVKPIHYKQLNNENIIQYIQKYNRYCKDKCEINIRNNIKNNNNQCNRIQKRKYLYYKMYESNDVYMLQRLEVMSPPPKALNCCYSPFNNSL